MQDQSSGKNRGSGKIILAGLALLLVGAIAGAVWLAQPPAEPTYEGKTLTYWLTNWQNGSGQSIDDAQIVKSREAVRHIGTNAVPTLLRMLRAKDSTVKIKMYELMSRQDKFNVPFTSVEQGKPLTQIAFWFLGDLATNAAPALIQMCTNENDEDSFFADRALQMLYPAPCVARAEWMPPKERAPWYLATGMMQKEFGAPSNAILAFSEAIKLNPTNRETW